MRVLFDQGTPAPLRHLLPIHEVFTAYELGWSTFKNGELLAAAERQGFHVLVTTDTNLKYQQNLASRSIAGVVLGTTSWPRIKAAAEVVVSAIDAAVLGMYVEVVIPLGLQATVKPPYRPMTQAPLDPGVLSGTGQP